MLETVTPAAEKSVSRNQLACPACGGSAAAPFFEQPDIPVHCNILWPTADAGRAAPRGAMRLALCDRCGLLFNAAFDPALVTYDESYENSLHYSPRFEAYAAALAEDLGARLSLRGRLVVEVGCGKGEFLRRLCATAGAQGLGIDASYDPTIAPATTDDHVRFVREPFSSLQEDLQPALVFCRHVLEHVREPHLFMSELAAAAARADGCRVFVEVPNALFTLKDLGIWDLIYEHYSYFTAPALARLCERSGLQVERTETVFGNQFLCVEAVTGTAAARDITGDLVELRQLADRFSLEYREKVVYWEQRLRALRAAGSTVALWGAGSKGITFVNVVPGAEMISCLVDVNPRKQGRFVAGTGQPVVGPEALTAQRPDVILVMNPQYRSEIGDVAARLGLSSSVEVA